MREEILKILKYQYNFVIKSSVEMQSHLYNLDKFGEFIYSFNIFIEKNDKYLYMLGNENVSKLVDILLFGRREYRFRLTPFITIEEATLIAKVDSYYKNDDINKMVTNVDATKKEKRKLDIRDESTTFNDIIVSNYNNINTLINDDDCIKKLSSNPTFLDTTAFMMRYFPDFYFDYDILETTKEIIRNGHKYYNKDDRKNAKMIIKKLNKISPEEEKILKKRKF